MQIRRKVRTQVVKVLLPSRRIPSNKVAYSRIWSRRNPSRFYGRARNSWDRGAAFDSQKERYTPSKFGKEKGPSQGAKVLFSILFLTSAAFYAPKLEDRTQEETLKQERCGRRVAWKMAKVSTSSMKWTKPHSIRPQKFGVHRRHLQRNPRMENLIGAAMHMQSRKDL